MRMLFTFARCGRTGRFGTGPAPIGIYIPASFAHGRFCLCARRAMTSRIMIDSFCECLIGKSLWASHTLTSMGIKAGQL